MTFVMRLSLLLPPYLQSKMGCSFRVG